jgi:hypothetical protein
MVKNNSVTDSKFFAYWVAIWLNIGLGGAALHTLLTNQGIYNEKPNTRINGIERVVQSNR